MGQQERDTAGKPAARKTQAGVREQARQQPLEPLQQRQKQEQQEAGEAAPKPRFRDWASI